MLDPTDPHRSAREKRTRLSGTSCLVCGVTMRRVRTDQRYCSAACRRRGYRDAAAERRERMLPDDPGRPE